MNREEMEKVIELFTEIQECNDKKTAFIKGAIFGIEFVQIREPNWKIIEDTYKRKGDNIDWIKIEKDNFQIERKIRQDQIDLLTSILNNK